MRNKLKRSGKCEVKAASSLSEEQQRTDQSITLVLSESSCSNYETSPETVKPHTFCVKDVKIAPLFFHAKRHSKTKGSSDGQLDWEPVPPPPPPPPPQAEEDQQSLSSVPHLTERQGKKQLPASALHSCLEEIQTSNPAFPVRAVFSTLQKRLQDFSSSAENLSSLQSHLKEKRKRGNDGVERVSKRLRSSLSAEGPFGLSHRQDDQKSTVLMVRTQRRSSKLSHTHRLRQQSGSLAGPVLNHQDPGLMNPTASHTSEVLQTDSSPEDVLWTDKYSPQHSSEVIGNSASVNKLQSWLKKWKQRADSDERRRMEERKREENSSDSWDCGDFQGEAGPEEPLSNTMLITGPPGVGKTASVYACALELGFKVFEVNSSSQRSGRHILSQLQEATQSHLVETSGKDSLKPTYFNNYSINSITPKPSETSGINVRLKKVASTFRKRAVQKSSFSCPKRKASPATVTLANFFQMKAKADRLRFSGLSTSEKPDKDKSGKPSPGSDQTVPQNKKTATSLILFEEVDVIFDDDVGFLSAIKTFMMTAKRPVILTTNDPSFRERFNCSLEEILFKTPSAVNVCSYLQLLGLAEDERLELDDVRSLLSRSGGDVRRCVLQLQLWVQSGGRFPQEQRCTASMLGLHPVTRQQLLNLLKCQFWSETDMSTVLRLLAESWRGGVPLLYTHLELLLPVGAEAVCPELQSEPVPSDGKLSATNSKSFVKISRLSRRKYITSVSDTTSSSGPQQTERSSTKTRSRVNTEESKAKVITGCLEALAHFLDLMSYLDSTVPLVSGSEPFVWTGAELKDGLSDETSEDEEAGRLWSQGRLLDLQAAVEGLGAHRCFLQYRQELGDTGWGTLASKSSSKKRSFSFSFQSLCAPSVTRRRYELSRAVLSSKSFSLLGNRRAVSGDYMPVLRYICRLQREQQQKEEAARSGNYLSRKHLGLSKSTVQLLAEDFS